MQDLTAKRNPSVDPLAEETLDDDLEDSDEGNLECTKALYPRLLVDPASGHHHFVFLNSLPGLELKLERWPNKLDVQATYELAPPSAGSWADSMPDEYKPCISFPNQETRDFFESARAETFVIPAPDGTEKVETHLLDGGHWKVLTFKMHPSKVGDTGMIKL